MSSEQILFVIAIHGLTADIQDKKVPSALQLPYPSILRGLGVSFCAILLHNSLMSILQDIFQDHYEEMIYTLHPRASVIENVDKMINCGNAAFGGAMYGCPSCGKLKFIYLILRNPCIFKENRHFNVRSLCIFAVLHIF